MFKFPETQSTDQHLILQEASAVQDFPLKMAAQEKSEVADNSTFFVPFESSFAVFEPKQAMNDLQFHPEVASMKDAHKYDPDECYQGFQNLGGENGAGHQFLMNQSQDYDFRLERPSLAMSSAQEMSMLARDEENSTPVVMTDYQSEESTGHQLISNPTLMPDQRSNIAKFSDVVQVDPSKMAIGQSQAAQNMGGFVDGGLG